MSPRPPAAASTGFATAMIAVAAIGFGLVPLFGRTLMAMGFSAEAVTLYRNLLSLLVALPFLPLARTHRRSVLWLVGAGMAMGASWAVYMSALQTVPIAAAGIVYMTYPLFVLPIAWLLVRQPIGARAILAGALVLSAAALVIGPAGLMLGDAGWRLLACVPAPIGFAVIIVVGAQMTPDLNAVQKLAASMIGLVGVSLPLTLAGGAAGLVPDAAVGWAVALPWLVGMALATATVPQIVFIWAAPRVGAAHAAVAGSVELPVMLLIGWLAFAESLGVVEVTGAALVCLAIVLSRAGSPQPRLAERVSRY